jgi:hypothetical protein
MFTTSLLYFFQISPKDFHAPGTSDGTSALHLTLFMNHLLRKHDMRINLQGVVYTYTIQGEGLLKALPLRIAKKQIISIP